MLHEAVLPTISEWRLHPEVFAREAEGWTGPPPVPIITDQQLELFQAVGKMVRAKMKYKEVMDGLTPRSSITADEWEQIKKSGISVMSGKGTGKDAAAQLLIKWFLYMFPRCKSPITGPSYEQVRKGLIAEAHKWTTFRNPKTNEPISILCDEFEIQRDMIFLKSEGNKSRFFAVRTAPPDADEARQKGVLDGWHEDAMMIVVDEAASVPDGVFASFATTLTKPLNFVLLFFNPTRNNGFAYETHFGKYRESFVQLHWDSRYSPLVTEVQLAKMEHDYGKDGPEYRINVLGLPPVDDPSAMIPRSWVQAAVDRWKNDKDETWKAYPTIAAFDPGGGGTDESAYLSRRGKRVIRVEGVNEANAVTLGEWCFQQMIRDSVDVLYVDNISIGGPMLDHMKKDAPRWGFPASAIRAADVRKTATNPKYARMRDQAWWNVRQWFQDDLAQIPDDPKFKNELGSIMMREPNTKGQTVVESKEQMKARRMPSPNRGDALMMTLFAPENALMEAKKAADGFEGYDDGNDGYDHRTSWMGR